MTNDMGAFKQRKTDWVREELEAWAGCKLVLETKYAQFTQTKDHVLKEIQGWHWCEE